ncbi:response regulator transcription factor [Lichenicola cladoniae]|nr:response regulator transcription factor [Lichenicola cladoniae]
MTRPMRILLIEDHATLREMLSAHLRHIGFAVDVMPTGRLALAAAAAAPYNAIVLDLGLPDMDGMAVLEELRGSANADAAVLILTARGGLEDRVAGLDAGADDYLLKPFDLPEFDARLRAVIRHGASRAADRGRLLRFGDLAFDAVSREAQAGPLKLSLTRRERALLEALLEAGGRTVQRDAIEGRLYSFNEPVGSNALEAAVSRLRRHLADAGSNVTVENLRGVGYRLLAFEPHADETT